MVQLHTHPGYSVNWACGVCQSFEGKYARATEMVCKEYRIPREMVVMWIADWPERWTNYKKVVKRVHSWMEKQDSLHGNADKLLHGCVVDAVNSLKKDGHLAILG